MTAGLPGLGLSGLFVLISAFILPTIRRRRRHCREVITRDGLALTLVPTTRHRRLQQSRQVLVLVGLTVAIIIAVLEEWDVIIAVAGVPSRSGSPVGGLGAPSTVGVPIIVLSLAILASIIMTGEVLLHTVGVRLTPTPPPVELDLTEAIAPPRHTESDGSKIPGDFAFGSDGPVQ